MTEHNDRLDVRSHDVVSDEIQKLLEIFPSVRSEDGRVNFEALKTALGGEVSEGRERFGMSWPGKAESIRAAQKQSVATLLPVEKESVDFESTGNVIIEGDNLEVLKLLQKSYLGQVKMIYIDPPYNTGNDFIYPDNYSESLQTYLEYTGQVGEDGKRFSTNTETDGRFHSKWMSMMYPRLMLARNLLTEDGVILISIDDNEVANLIAVLNEVFGEHCVERYIWDVRERGQIPKTPKSTVRKEHEYLLAAWKKGTAVAFKRYLDQPYLENTSWTNVDNDPRGPWMSGNLSRSEDKQGSGANYFAIVSPAGVEWTRTWTVDRDEFARLNADGRIYFADEGRGVPRRKIFKSDVLEVTQSSLFQNLGSSQSGARMIKDLMEIDFPYPKPVQLLQRLCALATDSASQDVVLDFFAGSGTTGHAVLAQNAKDGGSRRFILVQLPEPVEEGSEAAKAGFESIADITKERVRRAAKEIAKEAGGASKLKLADGSGQQDLGFRVFKLDKSNFQVWDAAAPAGDEAKLVEQLELQVEHVEKGRKGQDVVFEVLLKSKLPLTSQVEKMKVSGGEVWSVESGRLLVVVDEGVDLAGIRELAKRDPKPETVVFLDRCFGGKDSLKANARKIFQDANIDLKTI